MHFATICLAAFIFHVYRSLNIGQDFDLAVNLLDDIAFAFFAPLFLHFCLRYPVRSEVFDESPWRTVSLYIPATLVTMAVLFFSLGQLIPVDMIAGGLRNFTANNRVFSILNQILLVHFVAGITIGGSILIWRFLTVKQTLVRQRLKWAMWGTVASILPILAFQIAKRFVYLPEDTLTTALTTLPPL